MKRDDRQVNVRLAPARFEILDAAAFAQRTTPATLMLEAAEDLIDNLATEASVQTAMQAREQADSANARKVSPLEARTGTLRRKG